MTTLLVAVGVTRHHEAAVEAGVADQQLVLDTGAGQPLGFPQAKRVCALVVVVGSFDLCPCLTLEVSGLVGVLVDEQYLVELGRYNGERKYVNFSEFFFFFFLFLFLFLF